MLQHALPIALMIAMIMTRQGLPDKTRSPQQTDALKVSITSGKETYRIAEPIDLRVTLENGGKMTIFVGQTIRRMDWICSIRIRVSDESGRPSPELHWNHPFMSDYDSSQ